jgi:hypothetical protein
VVGRPLRAGILISEKLLSLAGLFRKSLKNIVGDTLIQGAAQAGAWEYRHPPDNIDRASTISLAAK